MIFEIKTEWLVEYPNKFRWTVVRDGVVPIVIAMGAERKSDCKVVGISEKKETKGSRNKGKIRSGKEN